MMCHCHHVITVLTWRLTTVKAFLTEGRGLTASGQGKQVTFPAGGVQGQ